MTVIDGATLATTDVPIGGYLPFTLAVNSVTNKIYVPDYCGYDPSCQRELNGTVSVDRRWNPYLHQRSCRRRSWPPWRSTRSLTKCMLPTDAASIPSCQSSGTVTIIDGTTLTFTNVGVGHDPQGLSLNSVTNRVYVPNFNDDTVSVIADTPPTALQFVPLTAAVSAVDTRPEHGGGGPIQGGTFQNFPIPAGGKLQYSRRPPPPIRMNVSVVPQRTAGLPDGVARGTAAAFGFDFELAGWPHQGQRRDRAGGHQRTRSACTPPTRPM